MLRKLDVTAADLAEATWQSAGGGNDADGSNDESHIVEVAAVQGGVAMRDSSLPQGPILLFTEAEWTAFVAGAAAGEFDVPVKRSASAPGGATAPSQRIP